MKRLTVALAVLGFLAAAAETQAQQRWAFELRVNGDVPTRDVGNDDFGTGLGFEGSVRYRFMPHLAGYAGWDWVHFNPDESFAGSDMDIEETGYVFGLRFEHPFSGESGGPAYWVRAGGTVNHIEVEDQEGEIVSDSGHGLGWEAAAGLALGLGSRWSFTPGVRYRALTRDVEMGAATTEVNLRYVSFELGLARSF